MALFRPKNPFLAIFLDFSAIFCFNLAKECKKWSLTEKASLTIFVVFRSRNCFFLVKNSFLTMFGVVFLPISGLNLSKKCFLFSFSLKCWDLAHILTLVYFCLLVLLVLLKFILFLFLWFLFRVVQCSVACFKKKLRIFGYKAISLLCGVIGYLFLYHY